MINYTKSFRAFYLKKQIINIVYYESIFWQDYVFQWHVKIISTWYRHFIIDNTKRREHEYKCQKIIFNFKR